MPDPQKKRGARRGRHATRSTTERWRTILGEGPVAERRAEVAALVADVRGDARLKSRGALDSAALDLAVAHEAALALLDLMRERGLNSDESKALTGALRASKAAREALGVLVHRDADDCPRCWGRGELPTRSRKPTICPSCDGSGQWEPEAQP